MLEREPGFLQALTVMPPTLRLARLVKQPFEGPVDVDNGRHDGDFG